MPFLDNFGLNTDITFDTLFDLFDNITIGFDGDVISVLDGGIDTQQLADNSVTTSKIVDSSITDSKIISVSGSKITGTANEVVYYNSSGNLTSIPLNDGQLLIGSTGNSPVVGNITSSDSNLNVSNSAGSIILSIAQYIQNKVFETSCYISDSIDTTKKLLFDLSTSTTGTQTTLKFAQTANRIITFQDTTDTIAVLGQNQTFSGQNTFSQENTFTNTVIFNPPNTSIDAFYLKAQSEIVPSFKLLGSGQLFLGSGSSTLDLLISYFNSTYPGIQITDNAGNQAILQIDNIQSVQTNGNLAISGNGSGTVNVGNTGMKFTNSTLSSYSPSSLNTCELGTSINITFQGCYTSPQTFTLYFSRIGNICCMFVPDMLAPSTTSGQQFIYNPTTTGNTVPARFCPKYDTMRWTGLGMNNGSNITNAGMDLLTNGIFNFYINGGLTNWGSTGTNNGVWGFCVAYICAG